MKALLAFGCACVVASCSAAPPPAQCDWGVALDGNPVRADQLQTVTAATGIAPRLVVFFEQWPEDRGARTFPLESVRTITAAGALPVITWEPMFYRQRDGAETMIESTRIVAGDYDGYVEHYARECKTWGRPIVLRFAHEMNLSRYHWGSAKEAYGPESPARYRAMWQHVVGIFRRVGATNVSWAFCANVESVPDVSYAPDAAWNRASAYYPGDAWVDLLGMDGYNWGDTQTPEKNGWRSSWRRAADIFGPIEKELRALSATKPLYVFETATAPTGGDKTAWLAEIAAIARTGRWRGLVWFEADKEVPWRLAGGVPPAALTPLREAFGAK
jgi:beta-mannanase